MKSLTIRAIETTPDGDVILYANYGSLRITRHGGRSTVFWDGTASADDLEAPDRSKSRHVIKIADLDLRAFQPTSKAQGPR